MRFVAPVPATALRVAGVSRPIPPAFLIQGPPLSRPGHQRPGEFLRFGLGSGHQAARFFGPYTPPGCRGL